MSTIATTSCRWYDYIPYGVLLLTCLYIAFVSFIYTYSPECLDRQESCLSGRIDDSTIAWATAFYASFSILLLALHLVYIRYYQGSNIRLSGIWAQVFMAIGLALQGGARIFYGDDQGQGATGFFSIWSASFFYMTLSCLFYGKVVRLAIKQNDTGGGVGCCHGCWGSRCALWMATTMVFCAAITILGGSIKCAIPFDDGEEIVATNQTNATNFLAADNIFGNAGSDGNQTNITIVASGLFDKDDRTTCENVVYYGEIGWYCSYAWFWVAAGTLCWRAIRGKQSEEMQGYPMSVLGLGTAFGSLLIPLVQLTMVLYPIWLLIASVSTERAYLDLMEDCYGSIVFHFGILLTFYLAHNFTWALTAPDKPRRGHIDEVYMTDEELSYSWTKAVDDLTFGIVAAPKKEGSDDSSCVSYDTIVASGARNSA
jgi:hypothetical protein